MSVTLADEVKKPNIGYLAGSEGVDTPMSGFFAMQAPLPLHSLPDWIDVSAMAIAAAFGAAAGRNRGLPLLAVLAVGIIAGIVGGMIRDVLLGLEAAAIKNWYNIPAVLLAAVVGGFLAHRLMQGHAAYVLVRGVAIGLLINIGV